VLSYLTIYGIASDPPGIYNVVTSEAHSLSTRLPEKSIFRINTGAPLPLGADTVIMVEDTRLMSTIEHSSTSLLGEEKEVETLAQVPPGDNVRSPGSDVRKGDLVMRHGDRISRGGGEVGTLTFVGRKEVGILLQVFHNLHQLMFIHRLKLTRNQLWQS
jgi:gephyrin